MKHAQTYHLKWQVAKFAKVEKVALKYNVLGPEGPGLLYNPQISFSKKYKLSTTLPAALVYVTLRRDPLPLENM